MFIFGALHLSGYRDAALYGVPVAFFAASFKRKIARAQRLALRFLATAWANQNNPDDCEKHGDVTAQPICLQSPTLKRSGLWIAA
jgi:hypothetical protein